MGLNSRPVTISDMDGNEHTVEVPASTLFEAVALGLHSIKTAEWCGECFQKVASQSGGSPHHTNARNSVKPGAIWTAGQ